jgi:O-methyltransferase
MNDRVRFQRLANKEWHKFDRRIPQAFLHSVMSATTLIDDAFLNDDSLTWFKSCGFMHDEDLNHALGSSGILRARWWRMHVLTWAAEQALQADGDFVDVGCYDCKTVEAIQRFLGWWERGNGRGSRRYWCYDIFDSPPKESEKEAHGPDLQRRAAERLSTDSKVIKSDGTVCPEMPDKIAFAQTDLNDAGAEGLWLEHIYPRLSLTAIVIHDDYGWSRYADSKRVIDRFLLERGHRVLELPTGQGMWIR